VEAGTTDQKEDEEGVVDGILMGNYTYYKLYLLEDNSNLN
jgi:hypothetical protein